MFFVPCQMWMSVQKKQTSAVLTPRVPTPKGHTTAAVRLGTLATDKPVRS